MVQNAKKIDHLAQISSLKKKRKKKSNKEFEIIIFQSLYVKI